MNAKDIIGMKIIDKNGKEVAKLADIRFNVKTYKVTDIYGSTGNPISKKYYEIDPKSIMAMGEYLLISETLDQLQQNTLTKIPADEETSTINQGLEKTVIDKDGNIAGKVTNIQIEKDPLTVTDIIVEKQSFGKSKSKYIINKDDIVTNGDYIILNKTLKQEEVPTDDKKDDDKKEDDDEE